MFKSESSLRNGGVDDETIEKTRLFAQKAPAIFQRLHDLRTDCFMSLMDQTACPNPSFLPPEEQASWQHRKVRWRLASNIYNNHKQMADDLLFAFESSPIHHRHLAYIESVIRSVAKGEQKARDIMPTGAGKTIAAGWLHKLSGSQLTVFVVPRVENALETKEKLEKVLGFGPGEIKIHSSDSFDTNFAEGDHGKMIIVSCEDHIRLMDNNTSYCSRVHEQCDLMFLDEAHGLSDELPSIDPELDAVEARMLASLDHYCGSRAMVRLLSATDDPTVKKAVPAEGHRVTYQQLVREGAIGKVHRLPVSITIPRSSYLDSRAMPLHQEKKAICTKDEDGLDLYDKMLGRMDLVREATGDKAATIFRCLPDMDVQQSLAERMQQQGWKPIMYVRSNRTDFSAPIAKTYQEARSRVESGECNAIITDQTLTGLDSPQVGNIVICQGRIGLSSHGVQQDSGSAFREKRGFAAVVDVDVNISGSDEGIIIQPTLDKALAHFGELGLDEVCPEIKSADIAEAVQVRHAPQLVRRIARKRPGLDLSTVASMVSST